MTGILAARWMFSAVSEHPVACMRELQTRVACPPRSTAAVGPYADTPSLSLPDLQAQDAVARHRRPTGVLLEASILIFMLNPVAYSTALSRTLPSHNPLLCSVLAWPALATLLAPQYTLKVAAHDRFRSASRPSMTRSSHIGPEDIC